MPRAPLCLTLLLAAAPVLAGVHLLPTPDGGIQPQAAVDESGALHLVYFKGEPRAGDAYYTRRAPGQQAFAPPVRVNSQPNTVIAVGTVRGAHLALGRDGRPHVAWMDAGKGHLGMYYARLDSTGRAFEPQRNLTRVALGLDGGGSVAADTLGNVYVAWHAGTEGEDRRAVWVARSTDDGATFAREVRATESETGSCGCCGMRALAEKKGRLYLLYRAATENVHRDMTLLVSDVRGALVGQRVLGPWELLSCPMSTADLYEGPRGMLAAWETEGQVYWERLGIDVEPIAAPGRSLNRKHPEVAANAAGETLLVWTEGTGWQQGGALAWQLYDGEGRPTEVKGVAADGVSRWSRPAAVVLPEGDFLVLH